jgi:hypothetical protein
MRHHRTGNGGKEQGEEYYATVREEFEGVTHHDAKPLIVRSMV